MKDLPDDALRMVMTKDCGPLLDYLRCKTCFDVEYVSFVLAVAGEAAVNELGRREAAANMASEEEFWANERERVAVAESVSTTVTTADDLQTSDSVVIVNRYESGSANPHVAIVYARGVEVGRIELPGQMSDAFYRSLKAVAVKLAGIAQHECNKEPEDPWVPQTTVLSRPCDQIRMVMDDGRTSDWIQATWSNKHLHGERAGNGRYEVQCRKSDLPKDE